MNLVIKLPKGALYQGDRHDVAALEEGEPDPNLLLVIAAEELDTSPALGKIISGWKVPLFDTLLPLKEQIQLAKALRPVVSSIVKALEEDKKVLVCCMQGWNRSGLLVSLTLRRLGYTGPVTVDLIRKARGPYALSNRSFEEMALRG